MTDPTSSDNPKIERPTNPYDPAWPDWNIQNPLIRRSVGAAAADGDGDGGGDGDDGGDGDGQDTGTGGEGGGDKTKLGDGGDGDKGDKAQNWRDGLDDGLKKVAEKFNTPADALKSYSELEGRLGKSVVIPGRDAKPEEVAAFHKKLGVPESPDGYKFELPKDLPEELQSDEAAQASTGEFLKAMHEAGAPPAVVQSALSWYYGTLQAGMEARAAEQKKATEGADASLQKEWGDDYKANSAFAGRAAKEFGGDAFVEFAETKEIEGVKVGDHPAFLRAFAEVGRKMGEGRPLVEGDSAEANTIQERIDQIHGLQYSEPAKYNSKTVQEELSGLYRKLHGSQPIVGAEGRTN